VTPRCEQSSIKQVLCSFQKGHVGRRWAPIVSPDGNCQRHGQVLESAYRLSHVGVAWESVCSGDQNLFAGYAPSIINFNHCLSASAKHTRSQHWHRQRLQFHHQKGGSQLGRNGVQHTCVSRHRRRQVPAPGQSMNWGWIGERLNRGQNLIDRYKIGIKNGCDSELQLFDLTSTVGLSFCSREVAR